MAGLRAVVRRRAALAPRLRCGSTGSQLSVRAQQAATPPTSRSFRAARAARLHASLPSGWVSATPCVLQGLVVYEADYSFCPVPMSTPNPLTKAPIPLGQVIAGRCGAAHHRASSRWAVGGSLQRDGLWLLAPAPAPAPLL